VSSKHRYAAILSVAFVISACTTSQASVAPTAPPVEASLTATATVPSPSPSTAPASPSASPSGGIGGGPPASPNAIDPCSLLTQAEASKLMGKPLSAGVSTQLDPDRVCTFKNGLSEVKVFLTPTAPDVATADAYYDAARADVPAGFVVDDINMFDRAGYGASTAGGISVSGLFVVDGLNGFEVYCGFPNCSETASAGAAILIAGRLP